MATLAAVTTDANDASGSTRRIFAMAFTAIVATSFCFVLRAFVVDDWGREFALNATQKGELLGAGLWPFALTIVLMSFVIDRIGFKPVFGAAAAGHLSGLVVLLTADSYTGLYAGTFILALANGCVEAAANPLVATIRAKDKTTALNHLHAGWPGGLVLGGLIALALGPIVDWRIKIAVIALPVSAYILLLMRVRLPVSERLALGVGYREMLAQAGWLSALTIAVLIALEAGRLLGLPLIVQLFAAAAAAIVYAIFAKSPGRPLYLLLLWMMIPLAITELSTDSWITSLIAPEMARVGLQAGWILVYMSAIVFVLRLAAGPLIHRFSAFGLLAIACALAAIGVYMLSASAGYGILFAATLFAVGKSFFWATNLGVAAERFPEGGAVTLNLMAGSGMLAAGIVGSIILGNLQDRAATRAVIAVDRQEASQLEARYLTTAHEGTFGTVRGLDEARVAAAPPADRARLAAIEEQSKREALAGVAVLPALLTLIYLALFRHNRRAAKPL